MTARALWTAATLRRWRDAAFLHADARLASTDAHHVTAHERKTASPPRGADHRSGRARNRVGAAGPRGSRLQVRFRNLIRQSVRQSHPRAAAGAARCAGKAARRGFHPARHQCALRHRRADRADPGDRRYHHHRDLAVAGARGARARRAVASDDADARQCCAGWRGRCGAAGRRRLRRDVPRQRPQRQNCCAAGWRSSRGYSRG